MVDSIKGSSSIAGASPSGKAPDVAKKRSEDTGQGTPVDQVDISDAALDLADVEKSTREAKEELQNNPDITLGLDPEFSA